MLIKVIKIPSLNKLRDKAQAAFNRFIRTRDQNLGCVSCKMGKVEHASHFYAAGLYTALRFNEDNVHGACLKCNYFLSGNLIPYRTELLKRIGQQRFDLLESAATRNRVHKWSRLELEEIYKKYKALKSKKLAI